MSTGAYQDLTGKRFGKLTVIGRIGSDKRRQALWRMQCDCGATTLVPTVSLKRGNTKSCGCLRIETSKEVNSRHGDYKSKLYGIWSSMKSRCSNSKTDCYPDYGGRGIKVCSEWIDYIPFRDWALANGYGKGLQIDRTDNDGNYEPSNCKFVTSKENNNNRRDYKSSMYIEAFGETKSLIDWSKDIRCKVKYHTLYERVTRYNWSPEKAISLANKEVII